MRYDWQKSYEWNYEHAPAVTSASAAAAVPGEWDFCGRKVASPLGIAAGPLLNGRWLLYYAALGFDVLTYKTVRSRARASYPMPNLQPVSPESVRDGAGMLQAVNEMHGSWAVSFGMPSRAPEIWRADVEATRRALPADKVLSVSVVATPEDHWTLDDLANDFANCARWAIESGADCVEANFSCPNVATSDGQLYHQPEAAEVVAARLRDAVDKKPLLLKIGHVTDEAAAARLVKVLAPHADALVMINCIAAHVQDAHAQSMFAGERRGIAGTAIREAVLDQIRLFTRIIEEQRVKLRLVGVGGIATGADVQAHLNAGSHAVQLVTAAMVDPKVGLKIRNQLAAK